MLFAIVLLVIGLLLLVYGAAVLARVWGVSPLIIGVMIVGIGTSLPELAVSVTAGLNQQMDMAVGNVLGSNIANIMLILGSAALIRPLTFRSDLLRRELLPMLLITLFSGGVLYNGYLSRFDGVMLPAAAGAWIVLMLRMARQAQQNGSDSLTREQLAELTQAQADGNQTVAVLWLLLGLIILPMAARIVIDNATVIARISPLMS